MDIFGGHHNIGLDFGVISMHFRVFFKVNWGYFLVAKISIFWRMLEIPDFLGGER